MLMHKRIAILSVGLSLGLAQAQDSVRVSTPGYTSPVRVSAALDQSKVPQNRSLTYTVTVGWQGDLDRFEVVSVETPVLTNLEVVAASSSNWVGDRGNGQEVVKTYEFTLRPRELGMGYIDGAIAEYRDTAVDRVERLVANRLDVTVIAPIPDDGSTFPGRWGLAAIFLVAAGLVVAWFWNRRRASQSTNSGAEPPLSLEERYLDQLRIVNLDGASSADSFSMISKVLRHYLSEKYDAAISGLSTDEIRARLEAGGVAKAIISDSHEVLSACDVVKFSGAQAENSTLVRAYTLVESMLDGSKSGASATVTSLSDQSNNQNQTGARNGD